MSEFDVTYNLKVTGVGTISDEVTKLRSDLRRTMMLLQQTMSIMMRGDIDPRMQQALQGVSVGMGVFQMAILATTNPIAAAFAMTGLMHSQSPAPFGNQRIRLAPLVGELDGRTRW